MRANALLGRPPFSIATLAVCLVACRNDATSMPPAARAFDPLASEIPQTAASGTVAGQPFALRNARYYVDARPGYEQVDLQLNAGTASDPCAALAPPDQPRLWLRQTGARPIAPGETRLAPGEASPWTAHYQRIEAGRWVGNGEATGRLVVRHVGVDGRVQGSVSLCFDDRAASCVAGTFSAVRCPNVLDLAVRDLGGRGW